MLTVMIQANNGSQAIREALEVEAHDEDNKHGYINMVLIRNPDGSETKFYSSAFFVMNDKGATVAKYDLRNCSTASPVPKAA